MRNKKYTVRLSVEERDVCQEIVKRFTQSSRRVAPRHAIVGPTPWISSRHSCGYVLCRRVTTAPSALERRCNRAMSRQIVARETPSASATRL
jgi:hypothetical protein